MQKVFVRGTNVHVHAALLLVCQHHYSIDSHHLYPHLTTASHHLHRESKGAGTREPSTFSYEYFPQQEILST